MTARCIVVENTRFLCGIGIEDFVLPSLILPLQYVQPHAMRQQSMLLRCMGRSLSFTRDAIGLKFGFSYLKLRNSVLLMYSRVQYSTVHASTLLSNPQGAMYHQTHISQDHSSDKFSRLLQLTRFSLVCSVRRWVISKVASLLVADREWLHLHQIKHTR